ncbi:hypothetical protein GUJ93_ZPchr0009g2287 [Zizania palustris]|uniref:Uncharacterized protein n=1 Tax=Zizania palustris TaxID=103762 RepID=A0A8J5RQU0_ZIZPA|nr:hypothetical protein GUJ93_ZPchr0009g2287 [Zizania palustris]
MARQRRGNAKWNCAERGGVSLLGTWSWCRRGTRAAHACSLSVGGPGPQPPHHLLRPSPTTDASGDDDHLHNLHYDGERLDKDGSGQVGCPAIIFVVIHSIGVADALDARHLHEPNRDGSQPNNSTDHRGTGTGAGKPTGASAGALMGGGGPTLSVGGRGGGGWQACSKRIRGQIERGRIPRNNQSRWEIAHRRDHGRRGAAQLYG